MIDELSKDSTDFNWIKSLPTFFNEADSQNQKEAELISLLHTE